MRNGLCYLLLTLAMLFYGFSFISTKILLGYYGPVAIIFIRLVISSLFLFLIDWGRGKREPLTRGDWKHFLLIAFFQPFIYFLAETYGLKTLTASVASIIIATIPLITGVMAFVVLREPFTWRKALGMLLSLGGVALIVWQDRGTGGIGGVPWKGLLLMFAAAGAAGAYMISVKMTPPQHSSLVIVKYQNLLGGLMFLPLFLVMEAPAVRAVPLNRVIVTNLLLLALLPSTLAFIFNNYGVRRLGAGKASVFTNMVPVFTALFSFLILQERFSIAKLLGMAVVIGGVLLAQEKRLKLPRGAAEGPEELTR